MVPNKGKAVAALLRTFLALQNITTTSLHNDSSATN
jgi:hypothetical protein